MSKTILEDYVKNVQVDSDVQELEKKLRDVAAELTRTGLYRKLIIRHHDEVYFSGFVVRQDF